MADKRAMEKIRRAILEFEAMTGLRINGIGVIREGSKIVDLNFECDLPEQVSLTKVAKPLE